MFVHKNFGFAPAFPKLYPNARRRKDGSYYYDEGQEITNPTDAELQLFRNVGYKTPEEQVAAASFRKDNIHLLELEEEKDETAIDEFILDNEIGGEEE